MSHRRPISYFALTLIAVSWIASPARAQVASPFKGSLEGLLVRVSNNSQAQPAPERTAPDRVMLRINTRP